MRKILCQLHLSTSLNISTSFVSSRKDHLIFICDWDNIHWRSGLLNRICFTYQTAVLDSSQVLPKLRKKIYQNLYNRYKISIINVQLQQDFQNPVCGWLLVATTLVFPTYILSSLTSSFRAEISVSSQEWHYCGPGWPTLIGHWVSSQPTILPHLSLVCPSSPQP